MTPRPAALQIELRPGEALQLPRDADGAVVRLGQRRVTLSNLRKVFFPEDGLTKGDLLQWYADVAPLLLPHVRGRAMVMKRFPNGIHGKFFFMKRTPPGAPAWLRRCAIEHGSGSVIEFPVVDDLAALLWLVNLGCIDLNPWYARCDDIHRPDFLHFDLDPVPPADFGAVREAALRVREHLRRFGARSYVKTTGSSGMHVYVPIERGPLQKQVWSFAKTLAMEMAGAAPRLLTAEYRIARRPPGRVLVDYNQNAWGRTLASIYSVRPGPGAPVSMPVTWPEVAEGIEIRDFTLASARERIRACGDLWKPLLARRGRFDLEAHL